jgi:hypothetical protein
MGKSPREALEQPLPQQPMACGSRAWWPAARAYCVLTATLVAPRVTPFASLKRTNTRLLAGSKGTVLAPVTKIPKVGVSPALICVVTLPAGDPRHTPVAGLSGRALAETTRPAQQDLAAQVKGLAAVTRTWQDPLAAAPE